MADSKRTCSVDGCDKKSAQKGWCWGHYARWRRYGDPALARRATPNATPPETCTFDGCDGLHYSKGFCVKHYTKAWRYGSPDGGSGNAGHGEHAAWILKHSDYQGDDCIPWPFKARSRSGYGTTTSSLTGTQSTASREMCIVAHGEPPAADMDAAHSCGNGHLGCMNPRHLRWATRTENHADKELHGTKLLGEKTACAKLTADQAVAIYNDGRPQGVVAADYGITGGQVWNIRTGRHWSHVTQAST